MARLIGWVLLGVLVWWVLLKKRKPNQIDPKKTSSNQEKNHQETKPTVMVACNHCGIHIPKEEAILFNHGNTPLFYCCQQHAQQNSSENNNPQ